MTVLALDTEATGLDIRHGCRPFLVSTCNDEGTFRWWEWPVGPLTRHPNIPEEDIAEIQQTLDDAEIIVMHNTKFDVRVLESIGIDYSNCWEKTEDTLCASHVLDSLESHKLKDLAAKYCGIPIDDQKRMREIINIARRIARKHSWRIAGDYWRYMNHMHRDDPTFVKLKKGTPDPQSPTVNKQPKDGWRVMDMWLPAAVYDLVADDPRITDEFKTITLKYALRDAERTMCLYLYQKEIFEKHESHLLEHYDDHLRLLPVVYNMENRGISVRKKVMETERSRYISVAVEHDIAAVNIVKQEIDCSNSQSLQKQYYDKESEFNFNINSSKQMQFALYDLFDLPVIKETESEQPSTDQDTMYNLMDLVDEDSPPYQFLDNVISSRKSLKMEEYLAGYYAALLKTSEGNYRLHPNFNQTGTGTTRFSSSDPNAQNISKKDDRNIRCVFGPEPGRIWYAIDYENIEMRILSFVAGVQGFIDIFSRGESVHMAIARLIWPKHLVEHPDFQKTDKYRYTKNGNFAVPYGAGEEKADKTYKREGAYQILNEEFDLQPFSNLMQEKMNDVRKRGYIETVGGYRLYVPSSRIYAALNYFVQGTAGLICKRAMLNCANYFRQTGLDAYLIMNVHDEIVFDLPLQHCKKHLYAIKECMESPGFHLGIPSTVSIDRVKVSWDKGVELAI